MFCHVTMFAELYGKKAAALYTQAQDYQKTARFYYGKVRTLAPCALDLGHFSYSPSFHLRIFTHFFPISPVACLTNLFPRPRTLTSRPTTGPPTMTGVVLATNGTTSVSACCYRWAFCVVA